MPMLTDKDPPNIETPARLRPRKFRPLLGAIFGVFVIVAGVLLIVTGLRNKDLGGPVPRGAAAVGTVFYIMHNGSLVAPLVEFTDAAGKRISFRLPAGSSIPALGSNVRVSYGPRDPSAAHVLSDTSPGWKWQFYIGLWFLLVALGWYLLLARAITKRRARPVITSRQITGR